MRTTGNALPEPRRAHRCAHASQSTSGMTPPTQPTGPYPLKTAPGSPTAPTTSRARMHESALLLTCTNTRKKVAVGGHGGGRGRRQRHQRWPCGPHGPYASSCGRRGPIRAPPAHLCTRNRRKQESERMHARRSGCNLAGLRRLAGGYAPSAPAGASHRNPQGAGPSGRAPRGWETRKAAALPACRTCWQRGRQLAV